MSGRIIFVAGLVAAGKSSFSRELSNAANAPCFNKDSVKSALGEAFSIDNREQSKRFSAASFILLKHIAEQFMKVDAPVILESNFRPAEAEQLRMLCGMYHYASLCYLFTADMKVLHQRFMEREYSSMREPANNMHGQLDDFDDFRRAMSSSGLLDVDFGGEKIVIDTTYFERVDFRALTTTGQTHLNSPRCPNPSQFVHTHVI